MIKIIVPSEEVKQQLIEESQYVHNLHDIDSDKANTLMHLYLLPDDAWIVEDHSR